MASNDKVTQTVSMRSFERRNWDMMSVIKVKDDRDRLVPWMPEGTGIPRVLTPARRAIRRRTHTGVHGAQPQLRRMRVLLERVRQLRQAELLEHRGVPDLRLRHRQPPYSNERPTCTRKLTRS